MPITEAMACGCPVITCPLGSIPEVAKDAVLYVDSNDTCAMADALKTVQITEVRQDLIHKGLKRAAQFSWKNMANAVKTSLLNPGTQVVALQHQPEPYHLESSLVYRYKDFSIQLPTDHMLPVYQKQHPKYDRFLPHLAKYLQPSATVIDVGANVGDTLAGMVEQNSTVSFVCIEPDDLFYQLLEKNIQHIKLSKTNLKVQTIKALVGNNISGVSLEGQGGTKHAVINKEGRLKSQSLDKLLTEIVSLVDGKYHNQNIRIIKTDVDGFDYDVLNSSKQIIKKYKPIIFFECQYNFSYQKEGYEKLFDTLELQGYSDWTIFDNFGEIIIRTSNVEVIKQLLNYVWNQNIGRATRTIYYYDVLAIQASDAPLINHVLADYGQWQV